MASSRSGFLRPTGPTPQPAESAAALDLDGPAGVVAVAGVGDVGAGAAVDEVCPLGAEDPVVPVSPVGDQTGGAAVEGRIGLELVGALGDVPGESPQV